MNALTYRHPSLIFIIPLLLVAILAYLAPWIVNTAARSTLGAYDLAEWASLHPDSAQTTPQLLASLLLRLQPVLLTGILVYAVDFQRLTARAWMVTIAVMLLIAAQLPPFEFLTSDTNNPNYQQQFFLAGMSLIVGIIGLSHVLRRYRGIITVILSAVGIISAIWAIFLTRTMMLPYGLPGSIGIGGIVLIVTYGLIILGIIRGIKQIG